MSEEALMAAYVAGDEGAFGSLFQRLAPGVHRFFVRTFRDRVVADDLTQQTFLKMHRAREAFRGNAVRSWVFAIAARVRLDEFRRRRRRPEDADEEHLAAADAVAARARHADDAARARTEDRLAQIAAALERLPESQRLVIQLHRQEGLPFAQIAEMLGTTEGAIKLRAFRGYEQLRAWLAPLLTDDDAEPPPPGAPGRKP